MPLILLALTAGICSLHSTTQRTDGRTFVTFFNEMSS